MGRVLNRLHTAVNTAIWMGAVVGAAWLPCAWPGDAWAQDATESLAHGEINWSRRTVHATGSGAPSLQAANVAVARLGAERAAKMDALRNILETVRGIRIQADTTAGAAMAKDSGLKARIEGTVRKFKVTDTRYYSDGGVDVVVEVPLDTVADMVLPQKPSSQPSNTSAQSPSKMAKNQDGIIVNAQGLALAKALAPKLVDANGQAVLTPKQLASSRYVRSMGDALKDPKVGTKPRIMRALNTAPKANTDMVLSASDAERLTQLVATAGQLQLVIVTD